ncbi:discoidin domain-containing protein, partial [Clostridium sp.]|uniref:discoidin domain-containing protein n=1 Tax=Clostridium sp. TaxID=1506 RepID=UPI003F343F50
VDNANLQKEIEPFLGSYEALSHAGIGAMKAVIAAEKGDIKEWMLQTKEAKSKLASMQNFTVDRIEAEGPRTYVAEVGTKRLKPLVSSTITKGEEIMSSALSGDNSAKAISNIKDMPEIEVTLNEGRFTINNIENIKFNKNQYVGLALPKAMMASKIQLEASSYENLEVQASINGVEWTSVNGEVADGVFTANINEGVTFVRVVNKGAEATLDINKLEVTPIYKAKLSISQNIGTYQNYTIQNAIDGNMETKYWSDKPSAPGNYIQLDLGAVIPVYDITSYFGSTDKMRNSEYEISVDGANWTSLGELNYTAQGAQSVATVNANGQMAKYIRISAKGSNSGYWVQLYEMEVNKSVPGGGSDYVELVTGTPEGNFENLYDGDLSTAYEAAAVNEGDSLVYKMTRVTDVKELVFLQDENNICGAKVSVKDKAGNWTEVGTLSEEFNAIPVNKTILEVKLEFDGTKVAPKIYEIITREGEIEVPPTTGEAPNKPTEFKATDITKNSVSMTWEAPTNVEIKEYIIYRDGKEIGRTSDTSFVAEGLRVNSIYGFKIVAVSNEDKESKPISINVRTRK